MKKYNCKKCGAVLTSDEIALHRKLFNRAAREFWCLDCQAKFCGTTRERLEALIEMYYESGTCSLFPPRQKKNAGAVKSGPEDRPGTAGSV